ncbi:MAG: SIS domain-containing protein [Phycisphaeraceae bacterium]|nr:SIS domain-containing protein [Phycisphaeraceae bacterium]
MSTSPLSANIRDAVAVLQSLQPLAEALQRAVDAICVCLTSQGKLLCCGNGGSASDAAHFAGEFVCRFVKDRRAFPAIALGSPAATTTAIANDYGYDRVFARQVEAFARPGDLLVVFSTSGNSPSIIAALQQAKAMHIESVALLGGDGGACRELATYPLVVTGTKTTARIQEAHALLYHSICQMVDDRIA